MNKDQKLKDVTMNTQELKADNLCNVTLNERDPNKAAKHNVLQVVSCRWDRDWPLKQLHGLLQLHADPQNGNTAENIICIDY